MDSYFPHQASLKARAAKIVVLDANFYWAQQLFSACSEFADVLLFHPLDFRAFKDCYGRYFIDWNPNPVDAHIWEQRICFPPGWLFHYWPLTKYLLKQLIQKFQGDAPLIFVFSYPYYASLAKSLNAYSIYYSIDDYTDYWLARKSKTVAVESSSVSVSDLILCTAKHRLDYFQRLYPSHANKVVHLPHGCSTQFMVKDVMTAPQPFPTPLQKFERPTAGYIGALNYRFDFSFLASVAELLPEVTFVLGGDPPVEAEGSVEWWYGVKRCKALRNVHLIGFVPHHQLGQYLQSFDVLLMLYSNCNFNVNACPTKLWDYMGTALPIVANGVVPEVLLWKDVIHIAETPHQYMAAVKMALANPAWKAVHRLEIAKKNTWRDQAHKLQTLLTSVLA